MNLPATQGTRRRLALLFGVPVVFFVLFFLISVLGERNDVRLVQIRSVMSAVGHLRADANNAEIGEHGFLLTGDENYLLVLEGASARVKDDAAALQGNSTLLRKQIGPVINDFADKAQQRVERANRTVRVQHTQGFPAALELVRSANSERLMREVRSLSDSLQAALSDENARSIDAQRRLMHASFLLFVFGTMVMLLVLVWLYQSFVSQMQARDSANVELQTLNAELERRIAERTKELQEFNEELQQFAYVASHDLQEPLRTVTSFTQLLASRYKGRLDEDADEFMGYIVSSARRMTDLINGLLALVRLRKSGQPTAPVSFSTLLEQAEVSLQASIRENNARIESTELPALMVDGVQFAQVLQNLISNAIKYRRDEPPYVRVSATREATSWRFAIQDNGRGFDQQFAERIFGLFQRLHSRDTDGTGMGLTIVRRVVERHGGRIWAESQEGVGSTFFFTLPVSLESRAAIQPEPELTAHSSKA